MTAVCGLFAHLLPATDSDTRKQMAV